jgi:hAT family C-terminal dimerisation region
MLILDVKTRWSSTHQMMRKFLNSVAHSGCHSLLIHNIGRALQFRNEIDDFVGRNRDLRSLELDEDEWDAIVQVADWLMAFRAATTQMSTSKVSMLSTTHAIFRGLQEHIQQIYRDLPMSMAPKIKAGLLNAHKKLSDYYYKYDQSPFYTWAACESCQSFVSYVKSLSQHYPLVLDPRISYEGALQDYANDPDLLAYLESAKSSLHNYYAICYADSTPQTLDDAADAVLPAMDGSPSKVNFTSRYKKKERVQRDELEEYFKLPCEDFDGCKPVQWWVGRRAQFPNLYCLARDLLTIPGMFSFVFYAT